MAEWSKTSLSVQGVWGSIPRQVKLNIVPVTPRHRCDVFRSCVAQALSRGDTPCEYDEGFDFFV